MELVKIPFPYYFLHWTTSLIVQCCLGPILLFNASFDLFPGFPMLTWSECAHQRALPLLSCVSGSTSQYLSVAISHSSSELLSWRTLCRSSSPIQYLQQVMFLTSLFIAFSLTGMCQSSDTSWNILIIVHSSQP